MSSDGIRTLMYAVSPPWLQDGIAQKYTYICALHADALIDKCKLGVYNRFPLLCDPTALPLLGADYGIPQGPNEPTASYRVRLQTSWDDYRHDGSARAVMRQGLGYLTPLTPAMRIVKDVNAPQPGVLQASVWDTYAAGADTTQPPTHVLQTSLAWDWDGVILRWRAWWIIYSLAGSPWSSEGTWGDGQLWGDGGVWGLTATQGDMSSLRALLAKRRSVGSWYIPGGGIIVTFNAAEFDPTQPAGGGINPDGNWKHYGKDNGSGQQVAARFTDCRYLDGA